jgi:hemolysin-activating ACP:hemolysin acyltransferase
MSKANDTHMAKLEWQSGKPVWVTRCGEPIATTRFLITNIAEDVNCKDCKKAMKEGL